MKIQYQIMQVDSEHLKKQETMFSNKKRICFLEAKLENYVSGICDSMEEAVEKIQKYGNDYTEYTIIPRIYMTS
jgi:hypothetical protein